VITGMRHFSLRVADVDRSMAFYVIGFGHNLEGRRGIHAGDPDGNGVEIISLRGHGARSRTQG
jgi:catechol 2,3-dioxygenase-like lactoylglutathione lyase family enzyme